MSIWFWIFCVGFWIGGYLVGSGRRGWIAPQKRHEGDQ